MHTQVTLRIFGPPAALKLRKAAAFRGAARGCVHYTAIGLRQPKVSDG